jgi:hypothetical protein
MATAIITAATPTSECIAATSSGICVIWTRLAMTMPTTPPAAIIVSGMSIRRLTARVVATAMAMPMMPNTLPRRAVRGCDRSLSARMNSTLASR